MMCLQQSTSHGPCNRRRFLITGAVIFAAVFISVIIIVVTRAKGNECMQHLKCLPISKCEGQINQDFIPGCGSHDAPKMCCIAKSNSTENIDEKAIKMATTLRKAKRALLPIKCGIGALQDNIAGGENATLGMFPWMVILGFELSGKRNITVIFCGGTIISDRYILTAAHCVHSMIGLPFPYATLGDLNLLTPKDCEEYEDEDKFCSDDPITISVEEIILHENYNRTSLKNDIALLRLKQNITKFTEYIKPICLPFDLKIDENYFLSKNFTVSGWGKIGPSSNLVADILQYTTVQPRKTDQCNEYLKIPHGPVGDGQVCAMGADLKDACVGDSGGPMTYIDSRTIQIGVVSFQSNETCGVQKEKGVTVFTRVDKYLDWILDHIEP